DTKKLDFTSVLPGFLKKPFTKIAGRLLKSYPQLNKELCVGCGKCAESCPAHIIKIADKKAHFQKKGCISCFCCQEMCPMKAISVKKAL
ncbi:MAG: 4Fe-4S binding protein, partial [Lachnospiraceae bacterium]